MPGIAGRIITLRKANGMYGIELSGSGSIINVASADRFFIGDPVVVASENGKVSGMSRVSKRAAMVTGGTSEYGSGLGEYWDRKR